MTLYGHEGSVVTVTGMCLQPGSNNSLNTRPLQRQQHLMKSVCECVRERDTCIFSAEALVVFHGSHILK